MTPPALMRPLLVIGVVATLALTGCGTSPDNPVDSSATTTRVPSPSSSSTAAAAPAVVQPPTSETEAINDANRSVLGYYNASFISGHVEGKRLDLIVPWAAGPALRNERLLAQYLMQKNLRLEGSPTLWTLRTGRSSAARATDVAGGTANAFGSVQLVGCIESTNRAVGNGAPAWTTEGKRTSIQWSVLYDAARGQWLVNQSSPLPGGSEPLSCD